MNRKLNTEYYKQYLKDWKNYWGLFQLGNDSIKYEMWGAGEISKSYTCKGVILNDTTFKIEKHYRTKKKENNEMLTEIYKFKKFDKKPDSTNRFTN